MLILVDAVHTAADCPSSSSKSRELSGKLPKDLPPTLTKLGIKLVAGPFVGVWNHHTYIVLDAQNMKVVQEATFPLAQLNTVSIVPIVTIDEALKAVEGIPPIHP